MKKRDVSEEEQFSGDDPEDPEDEVNSGDDWTPNQGTGGGAKKRPQRAIAKKRHESEEEEEEDEDEEEEEEEEEDSDSDSGRKPKRKRQSRKEDDEEDEEEEDSDDYNLNDTSGIPPKDFTSGAFVISKEDAKKKNEDPTLWRIDGKALLQKYLPFQDNGKTLYKSTSTYSGWSPAHRDKYLAAQVSFKEQSRQEVIVELVDSEQQAAVKDDKEE